MLGDAEGLVLGEPLGPADRLKLGVSEGLMLGDAEELVLGDPL